MADRGRFAYIGLLTVLLTAAVFVVGSASASAMTPGAGWELSANAFPTSLPPGGKGTLVVQLQNVGAAASSGTVTVTDTLPPGLTATDAGYAGGFAGDGTPSIVHGLWDCKIAGQVVSCTNDPASMPTLAGGGGGPGGTGPNFAPQIAIAVDVDMKASEGEVNRVVIAGGGAQQPTSTTEPLRISSTPGPFRITGWHVWLSNADGLPDTQAGSHPYEANFSFDLANAVLNTATGFTAVGGEPRTIESNLPAGFIGDPNAVPTCKREALISDAGCPDATQVGVLSTEVLGRGGITKFKVFNMVPPAGEPAELGINLEHIMTLFDISIRTGGDYGITTHINNIPERGLIGSVLTLWGVPNDPSHNPWRSPKVGGCSQEEINAGAEECGSVGHAALRPFLTMPTACAGPQSFSLRAANWAEPATSTEKILAVSEDGNGFPTGFTGCEQLGFGPTVTVAPDTSQADTPAGLTVEVKPPVGGLSDPEGLGSSDIENAEVRLPDGLVINPGQAAGLEACQPGQDGLTTEAERAEGKENDGPPSCPPASKVGTAEAETPLLKSKLQGDVYVLQSNPPNLQLLIALSGEGVNAKLVTHVHLDEATGQLTATLKNIPGVPVSDFKLAFSGGGQAALATPTECGTYTSTADFGPWSSPFVADFLTSSSFAITAGSNGAPCPQPTLPFTPQLTAGSTTDQAGGFTNFSLLLQTADDQQRISALQFKVPQGLLGMISRVPLCGEPQAREGTCSSASQIGHTVVASGPGAYPLVVPQPGQPPAAIYLTGPYKGAPFGLSIVVPVVVGPFTLETQIVRAKIAVDPLTAQITVTTDPLPQIIDGVPTDLRTVNAVIDRPGFMFNPTSCSPMSFSGTAFSAQGGTAPISSHFQMGSCRSLLFKPNLVVSTSGKTSRKNGASLDARIVYPRTTLGANQASSQSNIRSVKVDLPRQLPSRLTTLQKACTSATFEANPANCPAASRVGTVTAVTPVLPVTLSGPAYFVSYGGAKFPELVFALQGYGLTVYVHGETFIDKTGITSSTFRQVPDVPIYNFELKLPQGPFSALAANGNLCKSSLKMPTAFVAQDGATIKQSTPIGVTGCAKHKAKSPSKRTVKHKRKK